MIIYIRYQYCTEFLGSFRFYVFLISELVKFNKMDCMEMNISIL